MKVSVAMITYNHEQFIAQAIESVLMQQVNFDYEIVIGEDCSIDHTRDIVRDYQRRYPDKIRLLLHEKNVGGRGNGVQTMQACQGEYIADLEGDDYWTSPHKLQKQVDFLDNHPECTICFHNVIRFYEDGSQEPEEFCSKNQKEISTLEDLLVENFIPTCSTMYRRGLFAEFPDWYYTLPMGDWPHHILNAQHGNIGYINEVMGAYRIHAGGVWSQQDPIRSFKKIVEMYVSINAYLDFKYESIIWTGVLTWWDNLILAFVEQGVERETIPVIMSNATEILDHWPNELPLSNTRKAQMLSKIYVDLGFASYKSRDLSGVRYCLVRAIRQNPSWLRNRGIWSIGFKALLGQRLSQ